MNRLAYAGIDGGGTKTAIVLVDAAGDELARVITGTSNAALIGHDEAGTVLRAGLEEAMAMCGRQVVGAWFGLSGADRPEDQRRLLPYLEDLCVTIRLTNDAELVMAALPNQVGLVVVAGTGSIAFGQTASGERIRAGGWGQILGDEGSGYDLARRMLQAYTGEIDGRSGSTGCTGAVMQALGLTEPFQLIHWVYARERTKGEIAALSSILLDQAELGDAIAIEIMEQSAASLALTAGAAAVRLGVSEPLPIALTGGLLLHSTRYREAFLAKLSAVHLLQDYLVEDPALTAARSMAAEQKRISA